MSFFRLHRKTTSTSSSGTRKLGAGTLAEGISDEKGAHGLNILHDPPAPVASFVFVHGLGGGSRKTWSKTASASHYWPQEWLSVDGELAQVQTLSFGYDSDWTKGKSNVLNIHHFGKALVADLDTSPHLQDKQTPIVLIGHSMGGCVIKKAYILASQDATQSKLVKRIRTVVFLATPHRGADLAKLLSSVLEVKFSSRAYVDDLQRCSEALQTINDEFRNYSNNVGLWSFYETQKLQLGMLSALVVAVDSATLGYREEKQIPITADHRSICKFDGPEDPNYRVIRNSLATIVKHITASQQSEEEIRNQTSILRNYLGVDGSPEDDLATVDDARLSGTCTWFSERQGFKEWHGFAPGSCALLWTNGKPAAGKTVLAGWLINQLQHLQENCSYYFFKHSDKSKMQLSACLRSLAFQMACFHKSVRSALLQMHSDGVSFDKENERVIWRKIFANVILRQDLGRHFWVIDALDECINTTALFESILPDLDGSGPLRVLITSRETPELGRLFASLGQYKVQIESITTDDTLEDMKLLIEAKGKALVFVNDEDRRTLMDKVMEKSSGSFLWTVLVMNELSNAHSEEEVKTILEEVSREMEPLYARALVSMARFERTKKLVKCILMWAACALRPLSVGELKGVLELEINDKFPKLAESIHTLCCQLVVIDRFGKVQMVHETARQFLLDETLQSDFAIQESQAHSDIVRACLRYLSSDQLKPPRTGRRSSASVTANKRNEFSSYACLSFANHLIRADPQADDILDLTTKFLTSNVLTWIESVAEAQDLGLLIHVSNRFKAYSKAVSAHRSPLCSKVNIIEGWAVDLARVAAKFGDALVICPWAIHSLIIPFCPSASTISKVTSPGKRGLSVVGLSSTHWDDRVSSISFHNQTNAIGQGDKFFAVGLNSGSLILHHAGSCQEYKILDHGEAVRFVEFKPKTDFMASCGLKTVKIWDISTGETLYSFRAPLGPIGLLFDGDHLMVACYKKFFAVRNLVSPMSQVPDRPWRDSFEEQSGPDLVPCALSFSVGHRMLAVGYVRGPITLWDIEANELSGRCCAVMVDSEMSAHRVTALVLNPNPSIELLAVSYLDGMLVLLDPFQDKVLESFRANCLTLASSADGQLLAAGAGNGLIQIYAFETLRMLYQVQTPNIHIKQLIFDNDSLRLMDIRRAQCNIWEPLVLLREAISDDNREISNGSVVEGAVSDTLIKISALCMRPDGRGIFCGKDDGSISVHDARTGRYQETLYRQKSRIRIVTCSPTLLLSVDISNVVSIWGTQRPDDLNPQEQWRPKLVLQSRIDCEGSISQAVLGENCGKFIVSTRIADYLYKITGTQESKMVSSEHQEDRRWVHDPQNLTQVFCIDNSTISVYSWDNWTKLNTFPLADGLGTLRLKSVRTCHPSRHSGILLELAESDSSLRASSIQLYNILDLRLDHPLIAADATKDLHEDSMLRTPNLLHKELLDSLSDVLCHVLGLVQGKRLVFLDSRSWVCSVDLSIVGRTSATYFRHFFVPRDWVSGMSNILCDVTLSLLTTTTQLL